ncbi:uncharacterized protein LOC107039242 [Diachasma alloeum]|uniref:uncharacterized protein LOC107039242 n=1 Tax=Diachasma alloeum TaxID=454923 RepID=UPI0007385104|nr:uncharacterized protein LOC107039242 [Diachasma alloeum]
MSNKGTNESFSPPVGDYKVPLKRRKIDMNSLVVSCSNGESLTDMDWTSLTNELSDLRCRLLQTEAAVAQFHRIKVKIEYVIREEERNLERQVQMTRERIERLRTVVGTAMSIQEVCEMQPPAKGERELMEISMQDKSTNFLTENVEMNQSSREDTSAFHEVQDNGIEAERELRNAVKNLENELVYMLENECSSPECDCDDLPEASVNIQELQSRRALSKDEQRVIPKVANAHESEEDQQSAADASSTFRGASESDPDLEDQIARFQKRFDDAEKDDQLVKILPGNRRESLLNLHESKDSEIWSRDLDRGRRYSQQAGVDPIQEEKQALSANMADANESEEDQQSAGDSRSTFREASESDPDLENQILRIQERLDEADNDDQLVTILPENCHGSSNLQCHESKDSGIWSRNLDRKSSYSQQAGVIPIQREKQTLLSKVTDAKKSENGQQTADDTISTFRGASEGDPDHEDQIVRVQKTFDDADKDDQLITIRRGNFRGSSLNLQRHESKNSGVYSRDLAGGRHYPQGAGVAPIQKKKQTLLSKVADAHEFEKDQQSAADASSTFREGLEGDPDLKAQIGRMQKRFDDANKDDQLSTILPEDCHESGAGHEAGAVPIHKKQTLLSKVADAHESEEDQQSVTDTSSTFCEVSEGDSDLEDANEVEQRVTIYPGNCTGSPSSLQCFTSKDSGIWSADLEDKRPQSQTQAGVVSIQQDEMLEPYVDSWEREIEGLPGHADVAELNITEGMMRGRPGESDSPPEAVDRACSLPRLQHGNNRMDRKVEKGRQNLLGVANYYVIVSNPQFFEIDWEKDYTHPNGRSYFCNKCPVKRDGKVKIQDHIWSSHYGGTYKCPLCLRSVMRRHAIGRHLKVFHPGTFLGI